MSGIVKLAQQNGLITQQDSVMAIGPKKRGRQAQLIEEQLGQCDAHTRPQAVLHFSLPNKNANRLAGRFESQPTRKVAQIEEDSVSHSSIQDDVRANEHLDMRQLINYRSLLLGFRHFHTTCVFRLLAEVASLLFIEHLSEGPWSDRKQMLLAMGLKMPSRFCLPNENDRVNNILSQTV